MEFPTTLKDLTGILRLRQGSSPYNLLLTSTVSLTPEILRNMCGSDNWKEFCNWLQRFGVEDRIDILKQHLSAPPDLDGHRALARLIKEGFFSTVLTTNVDSFLEEALFEYGVRPTTYPLLVVNRDTDEHITSVLDSEPRGICIVKLRGSLSDRKIPETYPEIFDLRKDLREGVERYLNRDIVIVGSIEREDDLHRLLSTSARRSIYYVTPEEPPSNDVVVRAIRGRRNNPTTTMISGPYGHFEAFFTALESLLLSNNSTTADATKSRASDTTPVRKQPVKAPQTQPPPQPPVVSSQSPVSQELTTAPKKTEETLTPSPSTNSWQKVQQSAVTLNDSQTSSPRAGQKKERELPAIVRSTANLAFVLICIGGLFLFISLFSNNTPSFSPGLTIFLLIVLAAIALGIIRFLNAKQVSDILTLGLNGMTNMIDGLLSKDHNKKTEESADKKTQEK